MKIRTATIADVENLAQMSYESFPNVPIDYQERIDRFHQHPRRRLTEDVLIGEVDGQMVATLSAIPYTVWIGGHRLSMTGIGGVANSLEARRQGYASQLCVETIRRAAAQGAAVSVLYAFRYEFYRRLGWGTIGELVEYRFSPQSLPLYPTRDKVRRFQTEDLAKVQACYQDFVEKGTCLAEWPESIWQARLKEIAEHKKIMMIYEEEGTVKGFVIFRFDLTRTWNKQFLIVDHLIYNDARSYQGLVGFLATLADQFAGIIYWGHIEEGFHFILKDPRHIEQPMLGGLNSNGGNYGVSYMLRVLNVMQVLTTRQYNTVTGEVCFDITDEQIHANNGSFCLKLVHGQPHVTSIVDETIPRVKLTIDRFSQLYAGALSATQAHFLGLIETNHPNILTWLDEVWRIPKPFLQDQF